MLNIKLIAVGKMKESHYIAALSEYIKRLSPYCRFEVTELAEVRLSQNPSEAEIEAALKKEATDIKKHISGSDYVISLCIEGKALSSEELAHLISDCANSGKSSLCFVIGSSFGLDDRFKNESDFRLSMSRMTFPHHLARVMLAEQIYRGIMINEGRKYHK